MSNLDQVLTELVLQVGKDVTEWYEIKNGIYEGMSIQNVNAKDGAREAIKKLVLTKDWYYHDPDELGEDAFKSLGDDEVDEL